MAYSANTPVTKPLVLVDVAKLLGTNIKDVGRLCTSNKINMWAKYKPVKYNTLFNTGKSTGSEYWKANDGSCGISMGNYIYTSAQAFVNAIFNNNTIIIWEHVPPTGGASFPYRLSDFEGYYHNAVQPFGEIEDNLTVYIDSNSEAQIDIDCVVSDEQDANLLLSDLNINLSSEQKNFADCYLAVAIKTSAKGWVVATSSQKMGTGSLSVHFSDVYSLGNSSGKTYDCILCVATEQYNSITGTEPSTIRYIGIPVAKKKIKFVNYNNVPSTPEGDATEGNGGDNAQIYILVCGEYTNSAKTEMRWWYECYNNSTSPKTLNFKATLGDNGVNNGVTLGTYQITVGAGSSVISDTYTRNGLDPTKNYWTWAVQNGTTIFGWEAQPVEEGFAIDEL